jgi:hypothetical protein
MMEVEVTLDFACSWCEGPVYARLLCSGKGLEAGPRTVAAVPLTCPHCARVSFVTFEPSGTVRTVTPHHGRPIPQPSYN